ncbi:MAG TPA: molybdenum ABC transporter ATP-binding protein [Desulfuromonadaceae bacterium]
MELRVAVHKSFGAFSLDADVTIQGDEFGIFGPSGSGKSTLVGLIAGLMQPDRGSIILDGTPLFDDRSGISVPPERRRIGIVFQHPNLFPHLNVRKNLLYGLRRCAPEHRRIDFDSLVHVLQLGHLMERGVTNLSGGEKQRVAIGRAVLSSPRLLLMDEPLSALDDSLRFQIITYLKSVCTAFRIPYLFISHSLLEMRLMADQVLSVADGRVAAQTTVEQLARSRMGSSPVGYINILHLGGMEERDGLCAYRWDGGELLLSLGNRETKEGIFELSSKDIILFKRHPEAISARNLLECTVASLFESGSKMGVELACAHGRLIAEIVPEAARELDIGVGCVLYAAIKASAFRRLAGTETGTSSP